MEKKVASISTSSAQPDALVASVNASTGASSEKVVIQHQEVVKKSMDDAKKNQVKKSKKVAKKMKKLAKKPKDVVVRKANDKHFIKERPKLPLSTIEKVESENDDEPPAPPQRKLPQRGPRVDYREIDVPDDDHFLCE